MILHLSGALALSDFRLNEYLVKLQAVTPSVSGLQAFYEYFVQTTASLSSFELNRFNQLLNSVNLPPRKFTVPTSLCLAVPRIGTCSPWSSKATDIATLCGFASIVRVERGISFYIESQKVAFDQKTLFELSHLLHDRMLETIFYSFEEIDQLFVTNDPTPIVEIDIISGGQSAVAAANDTLGLALSEPEVQYFFKTFSSLQRNPTDVELMMFAQANSEHCRHKIFNAQWTIDNIAQTDSLFAMIRNTHAKNPQDVLSAYTDNAAVFVGTEGQRFLCDPKTRAYIRQPEPIQILIKVETHNHPTAIAPFPGAATGSGGEIRDEGATGRGAKPKAGLVGFSVSHLRIPDFPQPWETALKKPEHIASSLEIMLSGPLGSAAFNNEFGRPNICGYFRTFEYQDPQHPSILRAYHKPIMLAGGMGNVRVMNTHKNKIAPEDLLIVLGGPALLIGLGGGSASSLQGDHHRIEQDFASVQRPNPEMQRRCQEVIDQCCALGIENPIVAIHDVGAGGLSNALPELVHESGRGAQIQLRAIPCDDPHLSPLEIWCNESQERYVIALKPDHLSIFTAIAQRERCPFAVVGKATQEETLRVVDHHFQNNPIDLPMAVLFGKPPKLEIDIQSDSFFYDPDVTTDHFLGQFQEQALKIGLEVMVPRVLTFPAVASKSFLITIGDRTVGGLVARDPMVGPWQIPIADVGVTAADFEGYHGEAMAIGERTPLGVMNPEAAARMAVGEAITNIAAASIAQIGDIKLSANWMAATKFPGEKMALFNAVKTVGLDICPALGISIPVGKDSLSMQMDWLLDGQLQTAAAPVSPIISAFAKVVDIRQTLTPELGCDGSAELWLIDLGAGKNRLGGSALMQVYGCLGDSCPDLDSPLELRNFFNAIQLLNQSNSLLAYHDRSDGGVWATLCEMAFAAQVGLQIQVPHGQNPIAFLFNEELGAVIQVSAHVKSEVKAIFRAHHLEDRIVPIATLIDDDRVLIMQDDTLLFSQTRSALQKLWSETSFRMHSLRDHPETAQEERETQADPNYPGLRVSLTFDPLKEVAAPYLIGLRPQVAILREQGVNGQVEMAAALTRAGFDCVDVHMSDLLSRQISLEAFVGFVAVGGFSYGDVLGAGRGWANSILHHSQLSDSFAAFFARTDTFALGVCNGCQMMAHLKSLIPGADHWPTFIRNRSEQFEARFSMVEIAASPSILFKGMEGSQLPIAIAHGEGRAYWSNLQAYQTFQRTSAVTLRYIDGQGKPTQHYPQNPNGSPDGIAGVTNDDGRFTLLMPHPERVFRTVQWSWHPKGWGENSPWMRMFANLRVFVG